MRKSFAGAPLGIPRTPRVMTAALLVALALTGCSGGVDTPPSTPTATPPAPLVEFLPALPPMRDASTLAALEPQRIRNDAIGVQARFSLLPGDQAINARVTDLTRQAVSARAASTRSTYRPAVFPRGAGMGERGCIAGSTSRDPARILADVSLGPAGGAGVAVVCDIVAAGGPYFGERIRVVNAANGKVTADATTTLYTALSTGDVFTGAELWQPSAAATLYAIVVEQLMREATGAAPSSTISTGSGVPPSAATLAAFTAQLALAVPAGRGALAFTVPSGLLAGTAPGAGGRAPADRELFVRVPATTLAGVATPRALALTKSTGAPFLAPAPVAAGFEKVDCTLVPCVALTYDDGPGESTAGILDTLAAHHAAATFFAMGEKAKPFAAILKRAVTEGHLVENHTWNHPHLSRLSRAEVIKQIRDTTAALTAATGKPVTVFRPPYGDMNASVRAAAGMPAILWSFDTFDWQSPPDATLIARAVDGPDPGGIVLQHDIQPVTARTAGAVYTGLADRGFTLVTVAQLLGGRLPDTGTLKHAP